MNTVAVIDADVGVRQSLHELIEAGGWRAQVFASAAAFLDELPSGAPHCLLLEVDLPDINGLQLQARLADCPETVFIFITHQRDVSLTVRAMQAGAVDYLTKPLREELVSDAIARAIEISTRKRIRAYEARLIRNRYVSLSPRERQVMQLVVGGRLNKQISDDLRIAEVTVKVHRGKLMRKMKADSLPHLVAMAGILKLQPATLRSHMSHLTWLASSS